MVCGPLFEGHSSVHSAPFLAAMFSLMLRAVLYCVQFFVNALKQTFENQKRVWSRVRFAAEILQSPPTPRHTPYLASTGEDHSKVSWDAVSPFDLHQISQHHKLSIDMHLLPLPDHQGLLARRKKKEPEKEERRVLVRTEDEGRLKPGVVACGSTKKTDIQRGQRGKKEEDDRQETKDRKKT